MRKKRVLLLFPTLWDAKQLERCRSDWSAAYEVRFTAPSLADCPLDLDADAYVASICERYAGDIDGVLSASDYPGALLASAVAARLGLPAPPLTAVLHASHKYYARLVQRRAVPHATPDFWLLDGRDPGPLDLPFPVFVKPVKGSFSMHCRRVSSAEELRRFLRDPDLAFFMETYLRVFNRMARRLDSAVDGHHVLAESLLEGVQVTIEGYALEDRVEILGVVDSIVHPDTGSFLRFDYPSRLPSAVLRRMNVIAERTIAALGLRRCMFNIELMYDPVRDDIKIIEVNPRMCGQFADLYARVDGASSYVHALHVAAGDEPPPPAPGGGASARAASFPLRVFRPVCVAHAPDAASLERIEAAHGDALVWLECETGTRLEDFATWEDGHSARYGIINVGAASDAALEMRRAAIEAALGIRFSDVAEPANAALAQAPA